MEFVWRAGAGKVRQVMANVNPISEQFETAAELAHGHKKRGKIWVYLRQKGY